DRPFVNVVPDALLLRGGVPQAPTALGAVGLTRSRSLAMPIWNDLAEAREFLFWLVLFIDAIYHIFVQSVDFLYEIFVRGFFLERIIAQHFGGRLFGCGTGQGDVGAMLLIGVGWA